METQHFSCISEYVNSALLLIQACLILLLTEEFSIVIEVHKFSLPKVEMVFELEGLHWGPFDNGYDTAS